MLAHSDTNVHVECCHAGCPVFQNCHVSEALGKVPFPADPSLGSAPIRRLHSQGDESASSTGRLSQARQHLARDTALCLSCFQSPPPEEINRPWVINGPPFTITFPQVEESS